MHTHTHTYTWVHSKPHCIKYCSILYFQVPETFPKESASKYHLSVNVHTVAMTIPEGVASEKMLEVCLESLLLSNKYTMVELSGEGGESYYPLGETIQMDFHQLSISRYTIHVPTILESWSIESAMGIQLWESNYGNLILSLLCRSFSIFFSLRKDEEDSYRLVRIPDAMVSFSHIVSRGIPEQALADEPQFKVSFESPKFEVRTSCTLWSPYRMYLFVYALSLIPPTLMSWVPWELSKETTKVKHMFVCVQYPLMLNNSELWGHLVWYDFITVSRKRQSARVSRYIHFTLGGRRCL